MKGLVCITLILEANPLFFEFGNNFLNLLGSIYQHFSSGGQYQLKAWVSTVHISTAWSHHCINNLGVIPCNLFPHQIDQY